MDKLFDIAILIVLFLMFSAIPFILILSAKKQLYGVKNIPAYNPALVGLYVMAEGRVVSSNSKITPKNKRSCTFFIFDIKSSFKAKRKKPYRGYETVSKKLYSTNTKSFELLVDGTTVTVRLESKILKHSIFRMHKDKGECSIDTVKKLVDLSQVSIKYKKFEYVERYLKEGDFITVLGRVERYNNKSVITETDSEILPFIIANRDYIDGQLKSANKVIKINYTIIAVVASFIVYKLLTL